MIIDDLKYFNKFKLYTLNLVFKRLIPLYEKKRKNIPLNKNQVVLISSTHNVRVVKFAYGLKKKGYNIILLFEGNAKEFKNIWNGFEKYCDKIILYKTPIEGYFYALLYNPLVYHVFTNTNFDVLENLIKNNIGKIVMDNYDGVKGFLAVMERTKEGRKIINQEKFCMENSDGLCCRSFESQWLKKHYGYKFKGKRILFFDYCWNKSFIFKDKANISNKELSFVYVGGLRTKQMYPEAADTCKLELAEILTKNNVNYYMYINKYKKNIYKDYIKMDKINSKFHFIKGVSYKKLLHLLKNYDYGCHICRDISMKGYKKFLPYYKSKYIYASTNKFFDYIDAGLPILAVEPIMILKYLSKYGIVIPINLENCEEKLEDLKVNYKKYLNNTIKARKELSINKNIPRLIEFYNNI